MGNAGSRGSLLKVQAKGKPTGNKAPTAVATLPPCDGLAIQLKNFHILCATFQCVCSNTDENANGLLPIIRHTQAKGYNNACLSSCISRLGSATFSLAKPFALSVKATIAPAFQRQTLFIRQGATLRYGFASPLYFLCSAIVTLRGGML